MSSAGPKASTSVAAAASRAACATGSPGRADHRQLAVRREVLVERDEQPAERGRGARQRVADKPQHGDASPFQLVVAPDAREAEEHIGEHGVAARRRMVVELLLACDELLAVTRRLEEAARLVVREQVDCERCQPVRLAQPLRVAGRDVQLHQAVGDVGVVLEVAGSLGDTVSPRAVQPAVGRGQLAEQEVGASAVAGPTRPPARARRASGRSRRRSPCRRGAAWAAARAARAAVRASPRRARPAGRSGRARTARAAPRAHLRPAPR